MSALPLFVAGAHTEIGKTHVACALIRAARRRGLSVDALKPVVSGFDEADWADSDPGRLLDALGAPGDRARLDAISPWRFAAPLAPPMAAEAEDRRLPMAEVIAHCRGRIDAGDARLVLVEGVGGLMSPIADGATSLELMLATAQTQLLVSGAYLGSISHALTALEVMRARSAPPVAMVLSEDADPAAPEFEATRALLAAHAGETPVLAARRDGDEAWADALIERLPRLA